MGNVSFMQILQGMCQLFYNSLTVSFRKSLIWLLFQRNTKWNAWQIFHDDIEVIVSFNHIHNLDNVRMVNTLKDFYLTSDCFLSSSLSDLRLFVSFYCNLLVLRLKDCHTNQRIRTLTDYLPHNVVLLEFWGQIFGVISYLKLILLIRDREPSEELIIIFLYLEKLD